MHNVKYKKKIQKSEGKTKFSFFESSLQTLHEPVDNVTLPSNDRKQWLPHSLCMRECDLPYPRMIESSDYLVLCTVENVTYPRMIESSDFLVLCAWENVTFLALEWSTYIDYLEVHRLPRSMYSRESDHTLEWSKAVTLVLCAWENGTFLTPEWSKAVTTSFYAQ